MFYKVENSIRKQKIKKKHEGIVRERARYNQIVIEYIDDPQWHLKIGYNADDFPKQRYIIHGKEYKAKSFHNTPYGTITKC